MKIESISCHLISSPYGGTKIHGQASGLKTVAIIESKSQELSGLGEVYVGTYVPEMTKSIVETISPRIIGLDINEALEFLSAFKLPFVSNAGIYRSIIGAIEISIFDLKARKEGLPLYKLFSDEAYLPNLYISGGSVITDLKDLENDIKVVTESNIDAFKMRVGKFPWEFDLERVNWVKKIEPSINLMVDAIAGTRSPAWTLEDSIRKFKSLEDLGLVWLEEPLIPENLDEYRLLRNQLNIPIAAGEAYSSITEFYGLIDHGNVDIIQFDVTQSGGINICQKIYEISLLEKRKSAFHVWGSLVAQLANFHLALSMKELYYFEIPLLKLDVDYELGKETQKHLDLFKKIPKEPGLGIDFSNSILDIYPFESGSEYSW